MDPDLETHETLLELRAQGQTIQSVDTIVLESMAALGKGFTMPTDIDAAGGDFGAFQSLAGLRP